jgi:ribulose-phosphate 3-epimerase
MNIIPAILTTTFEEFKRQAIRLEGIFDLAQIDVMDGQFVPNTSFPDIEKINGLNLKLNFELHLMVKHPLQELEKWAEVKNIKRVIFHIESQDNPAEVIAAIRKKHLDVGIAFNPETPLSDIEPHAKQVDEVLFMTVHPGQQGATFLPEVGEKIVQFVRCHPVSQRDPFGKNGDPDTNNLDSPVLSRGNDNSNIALVKSWGVNVFGVGSAISQAQDVSATLHSLQSQLFTHNIMNDD